MNDVPNCSHSHIRRQAPEQILTGHENFFLWRRRGLHCLMKTRIVEYNVR